MGGGSAVRSQSGRFKTGRPRYKTNRGQSRSKLGQACVCVYVRSGLKSVCMHFCYLIGTFAGLSTDLVRISSLHGDQRLILMRQNVIS